MDNEKAKLNESFLEIRKQYTDILKEILEKYEIIPEWVFGSAKGCSCGDNCSVGKTSAFDQGEIVTNPVDVKK